MAVKTTAGSDTIDTDSVFLLKKRGGEGGLVFEKQYFSSQIITTAIMFLTNGNPGLRSIITL